MFRLRRALFPSPAILHASAGLTTPILIGFNSNNNTDPTFPAHQAGDRIINIANTNASATPPTATGGGNIWTTIAHSTQNAAMAVYELTATGSSHAITWSGVNNTRSVWVFRDATIDTINTAQGTGTALTWPALASMAQDCLVGVQLMSRQAQTNIATAIALGGDFTQRVAKNSAAAQWVADTDTTLVDSHAPASDTLDSSSGGWVSVAFSMKGV